MIGPHRGVTLIDEPVVVSRVEVPRIIIKHDLENEMQRLRLRCGIKEFPKQTEGESDWSSSSVFSKERGGKCEKWI